MCGYSQSRRMGKLIAWPTTKFEKLYLGLSEEGAGGEALLTDSIMGVFFKLFALLRLGGNFRLYAEVYQDWFFGDRL